MGSFTNQNYTQLGIEKSKSVMNKKIFNIIGYE